MKYDKEIKIGITAIVAVLIVYFGIIFLKGMKLFHTDNIYYVRMDNVNGLLVAGDVISNGLKIGSVKSMDYNQAAQEIIVAAEVADGFTLPVGSHATIHKDMLGAPKLNIILGRDQTALLNPGDTIPGSSGGADVLSAAGDMIPDIKAMIPKIDSLVSALNRLANDPALAASLRNVETITDELQASSKSLNQMMASMSNSVPDMVTKAGKVLADVRSTTSQLRQVNITALAEKADATLAAAGNAVTNLSDLTDTLSLKLNSRSSSIGRLMNDPSVYVHLDSTLSNASRLMLDLRENPKRYVHFSIFGRKDK